MKLATLRIQSKEELETAPCQDCYLGPKAWIVVHLRLVVTARPAWSLSSPELLSSYSTFIVVVALIRDAVTTDPTTSQTVFILGTPSLDPSSCFSAESPVDQSEALGPGTPVEPVSCRTTRIACGCYRIYREARSL